MFYSLQIHLNSYTFYNYILAFDNFLYSFSLFELTIIFNILLHIQI